ncbi:hypothetical protein GCM10009304_38090 [Pseudomonas matsuisoli]|uniref:Uncharacterized protein n=1 Tax=Pseudomonas matsuisoli TaxID=1515666 RepID=A0A917Q2C9_9PSED|nr:hypothetical protein GCM10009304_38090 [Pseudomonas matsuisoli]
MSITDETQRFFVGASLLAIAFPLKIADRQQADRSPAGSYKSYTRHMEWIPAASLIAGMRFV